MSRNVLVIAGILCGLTIVISGCLLVPIEGGKALMVAGAGDYEEIQMLEPLVMSRYNGYTVGRRSTACVRMTIYR